MEISIVTPSLNMLGYLKRCAASVADQRGVEREHIVMDGGSNDGTAEWLAGQPSLMGKVQRDDGLYDAVNRGLRIARGEILAHLNCDEQYLPGTLAFVREYFKTHPEVDLLFGDTLTVRPNGALVAYRKTIRPIRPVLSIPPLYVPTAATFFRRRIVTDGHLYDTRYKDVADLAWVTGLAHAGYRLAHVRRYLATFAMTGANHSQVAPTVAGEVERLLADAPWWIRRLRTPWRVVGWIEKALAGCYFQRTPLAYAIYESEGAAARTELVAECASFRWRQ